ncbi:MAG: M15 family metallopeptidase [Acidobacteria bacterium]|nr:M15 family metallopeptidase [Acidobacteriota bacterium]
MLNGSGWARLGEGLGLRWGGRWKSPVDRPHFSVRW